VFNKKKSSLAFVGKSAVVLKFLLKIHPFSLLSCELERLREMGEGRVAWRVNQILCNFSDERELSLKAEEMGRGELAISHL
jgi:hypothetical protein